MVESLCPPSPCFLLLLLLLLLSLLPLLSLPFPLMFLLSSLRLVAVVVLGMAMVVAEEVRQANKGSQDPAREKQGQMRCLRRDSHPRTLPLLLLLPLLVLLLLMHERKPNPRGD